MPLTQPRPCRRVRPAPASLMRSRSAGFSRHGRRTSVRRGAMALRGEAEPETDGRDGLGQQLGGWCGGRILMGG